jgi:uncharacterized protein YukE
MSTGDWFTLKPLNLTNYQPQIDELNSRVSTLETRLTSLQQQVDTMSAQMLDLQSTVNLQGGVIQSSSNQVNQINNNITTLTETVNQLNTVNSLSTSVNDIVNLYKPIARFNFHNVNFTDYTVNSATGDFSGAWYRPIKLLEGGNNDGVDLKVMVLVLRNITINNIPNNGRFFFSDQLHLPISLVNNNNFRVFWDSAATGDEMKTRQADYDIINVPINCWSLDVKANTDQNVANDSACFIIMYI